MKKILLGAMALLFMTLAAPALALNCSPYTYTLTNGTTADANQVMTDLNLILGCANNNLAHNGANSDITSLSSLTTPLTTPQGGTGNNNIYGTANTWSAAQTFNATANFNGATGQLAAVAPNIGEPATVSAVAATGTINYDTTTQSVVYYTTAAAANWTLNIRGNSTTTLNSLLATGQSITLAFLVTQGATPFYNNILQIDGATAGVTTKWLGGAPTGGNASGIDVYTYTVIKTGSAAFTVLASQTPFN